MLPECARLATVTGLYCLRRSAALVVAATRATAGVTCVVPDGGRLVCRRQLRPALPDLLGGRLVILTSQACD